MARSTGYCNGAYSNQYDDQNAETRKEFGSLFQCYNETFVDDESYRSFSTTYLDDVDVRESPLGGSTSSRGNIRNVQETKVVSRENIPNATLRKPVYRRERSHSAPGRRSTTAVYAPISSIQTRQDTAPALRRSRSTVFYKPSDEFTTKRNDIESQFTVKHASTSPSKYACIPMQSIGRNVRQNDSQRRLLQAKNTILVTPAAVNTYVDVNSNRSCPRYCDISETSLVSLPTNHRSTTTNRSATNLAIIPPNHRGNIQSEVPLLAKSPDKFQATKRYSPSTASWVHLPTQPVATESLWLSGVVLLVTGFANCVLCFYIFSKVNINFVTSTSMCPVLKYCFSALLIILDTIYIRRHEFKD